MRRRLVAAAALIAAALPFAAQATAQDACKLSAIGTARSPAVRDGRTLMLADGRELRLAAIEIERCHRRRPAKAGRRARRCGWKSSVPTTTATAGWWPSPLPGRRGNPCSRLLLAGRRGAGIGAGRQQGLAPRRCWRPSGRPARRAAGCGPIPILPLWRLTILLGWLRKRVILPWWRARSCRCTPAAPHIYLNFGQALDAGLFCHHSAAKPAEVLRGGHRAAAAARPPHPGARLYRTAARPADRGRRARADRARSIESKARELTPWA